MKRLCKPLIQILAISAFFSFSVYAQEQAERLFDNATTFMNAGKYKEALNDLESLINDYGQTEWAPKALLKVGLYYLESEINYEKALGYFAKIQEAYRESQEAPAAYFYKASIVERQGESRAELESAVADLFRMRSLFPDNAWQNGALFLFGKLALRLENYTESLKHFQNLEFSFPKSEYLPRALLLSAKAAYLQGRPQQAALILARLQGNFPNANESEDAASLLRLLDRFQQGSPGYQLDPAFYGSSPKIFNSPSRVIVSGSGFVGIRDQRGVHFSSLNDATLKITLPLKDVVDFCADRDGDILLIYKNRILPRDGAAVFTSLNFSGNVLRDIRSAAVDDFGRLLVIDDDVKSIVVYSKTGAPLTDITTNRPKMVRTYGGNAWILINDGDLLRGFDSAFTPREGGPGGLSNIIDYRFDPYGNLYVLSDKGSQVSVFTHQGKNHVTFNLKTGTFPLKQAQAIAVDASGAIYLADRRGGAVYRFH